jgi:hypothetical protein
MKRHTLVALAFVATALFAIPALSHAQLNEVVCDLHTGHCTGSSPGVAVTYMSPPTLTRPYPNNTCAPGPWREVTFTVDLTPLTDLKQRAAFFTVEYEGTPWNWGADIGDAVSDDGYGGGQLWDPERAAEVQVQNQQLTVYNDPQIPGQVDSMLNQQLSLTNGTLKFGIANQTLAVGQPRTILATPVTKTLFQIPDPPAGADQWKIYAGFNRVVNPINSTAYRYGCGVRTVTVWTGTNPPGV